MMFDGGDVVGADEGVRATYSSIPSPNSPHLTDSVSAA